MATKFVSTTIRCLLWQQRKLRENNCLFTGNQCACVCVFMFEKPLSKILGEGTIALPFTQNVCQINEIAVKLFAVVMDIERVFKSKELFRCKVV